MGEILAFIIILFILILIFYFTFIIIMILDLYLHYFKSDKLWLNKCFGNLRNDLNYQIYNI